MGWSKWRADGVSKSRKNVPTHLVRTFENRIKTFHERDACFPMYEDVYQNRYIWKKEFQVFHWNTKPCMACMIKRNPFANHTHLRSYIHTRLSHRPTQVETGMKNRNSQKNYLKSGLNIRWRCPVVVKIWDGYVGERVLHGLFVRQFCKNLLH